MAEGAGEVGLAGSGRADEEDGLAVADPLSGGESEEDGAVEAASGFEVDVFDGGVEVEFGGALEADVSALFAGGFFAFEEEGEAVFEGEFADVGHGELFFEGLCHAGQSEFVEQVERGFSEHWSAFFLGLKYLRVFTGGRRSVWSGRRTSRACFHGGSELPMSAAERLRASVREERRRLSTSEDAFVPVPPGFGQGLRVLGVSLTRPERDSELMSSSALVPTFAAPPVGYFGGSFPPNRGDFPRGKGRVDSKAGVSVDPGAFVFPGIGEISRYPAEFSGTPDISPFGTERRHFFDPLPRPT